MEPMHALALAIVVLLIALYVFFWFILPVLWKYVLKPLGKIAYFLLLLIFGISFFMIFFLGKHFGIPEEVQVGMAIFSAIVSGVKWAKSQHNR
jgi:glucan phosphoethanolaminetransferase (alkaline phosphatase superfamily)